jgi:hypothetical protein
MNELLFESPISLGLAGIALTVVAAIVWINTGHKAALWTAAGLLLSTLGLLALERGVVTYREELTDRIAEIAADLEKNEREKVIAAIHPAAVNTIELAKNELPKYEFSEARITKIHSIEVDAESKRPRAEAEFNVFVELSLSGQVFRGARYINVTFYRENNQWLVIDYRHADPLEAMRQ